MIFEIEWNQKYDFDCNDAFHYKDGEVCSIKYGDQTIYIYNTQNNSGIEVKNDEELESAIDAGIIDANNRPYFYSAEYDGLYIGKDIIKSYSLREIVSLSKKYIEAKATV